MIFANLPFHMQIRGFKSFDFMQLILDNQTIRDFAVFILFNEENLEDYGVRNVIKTQFYTKFDML